MHVSVMLRLGGTMAENEMQYPLCWGMYSDTAFDVVCIMLQKSKQTARRKVYDNCLLTYQ